MTGDQLALQAIAQLEDSPIGGDMSPLGSALLCATKRALTDQSVDWPNATAELASALLPDVQKLVAQIGIEIGVQQIADIIPIAGQILSVGLNVADAFAAQAEAHRQANVLACRSAYIPIPPVGTGSGGSVTPADIFNEHVGTSVGRLFRIIGEESTFYDFGGGTYHAVSSPQNIKNAIASEKAKANFMAGYTPHTWGNPSGIPQETMQKLTLLRKAMSDAYMNSYDGGAALFPLYLDLFVSQYRLGRITKSWAHHVWALSVGGFSDISCTDYDRRSIDAFDGMVLAWERTAYPLYEKDKLALMALINQQKPKLTLRPLSGLAALASATTSMRALRATYQEHGLANIAHMPQAASPSASPAALSRLPIRTVPTVGPTMSPAEHQRIIDAIIAAAHGSGSLLGREAHVDSELDPNNPMTALPEFPQYQDIEYDDDDYAVVDNYWKDVHAELTLGGDDFPFYGPDCGEYDEAGYDENGEHVDDEEDLDPWGDQFLGVGASRQAKIAHIVPPPVKAKPKVVVPVARPIPVARPLPPLPVIRDIPLPRPQPVIQSPAPIQNVALPRPQPAIQSLAPIQNVPLPRHQPAIQSLAPIRNVPLPRPQPAIQSVAPIRNIPLPSAPKPPPPPPMMTKPLGPIAQISRPPIQQLNPKLAPQQLQRLRPLPPMRPHDSGAYTSDQMASDMPSDDELYDAQDASEYSEEESYDDSYSADEIAEDVDDPQHGTYAYGFGYGDYGDEECYPHDGSTYGWDDYEDEEY